MIFFITFLRALAAVLITNSHYTGVYPTDLIASGGLLGDVIFFAVSGYCLYNIKTSFPKWYGKRLIRCYLPVILITLFYMALGAYEITAEKSLSWWFLYPTNYHFVSSIVILYVPYFFIMKSDELRNRLPIIMIIVAVIYLLVYVFFYDKSYYHIDKVREPMVRFLFMESMLLGAWFRQNDIQLRKRTSIFAAIGTFISIGAYFLCKIVFVRYQSLSEWQILNQIVLFVFLFMIFRTFAGLDLYLEKLPTFIKKIISFIAKITLEIYVVQRVIIDSFKKVAPFPVNWLVLTVLIFVSAIILHYIVEGLLFLYEKTAKSLKLKSKKG